MTSNQSSADSFIPKIFAEIEAIDKIDEGIEEIDKQKGPLCADALRHAIDCGHLLNAAFESVKAAERSQGAPRWSPSADVARKHPLSRPCIRRSTQGFGSSYRERKEIPNPNRR